MSSQARQSQWTKDRRAKIKTQKTLGSSLRPRPPELQRGADSPSVHECQCGSGWGHNSWAHVFHRHGQMVSRDPGKDAAHIPDKCQGCSPQGQPKWWAKQSQFSPAQGCRTPWAAQLCPAHAAGALWKGRGGVPLCQESG